MTLKPIRYRIALEKNHTKRVRGFKHSRFLAVRKIRNDWDGDENARATPTFLIVICSSQKNGWRGSLPIWQPDQQQKAVDLANKITKVLP